MSHTQALHSLFNYYSSSNHDWFSSGIMQHSLHLTPSLSSSKLLSKKRPKGSLQNAHLLISPLHLKYLHSFSLCLGKVQMCLARPTMPIELGSFSLLCISHNPFLYTLYLSHPGLISVPRKSNALQPQCLCACLSFMEVLSHHLLPNLFLSMP